MAYGIPEAAFTSIEKEDKTQFFKCIKCAAVNIDNHLTDIYQINGTTYCLVHAKEEYEYTNKSKPVINIFNDPSSFNV